MNQKNVISSTSVDPCETEKFTALAASWWDPQGPFWPLHSLNKLRVQWILEQLAGSGLISNSKQKPLKGLSVLDVGCGGGILSESLAELGAAVTGIDVVEKNISIAKRHAAERGLYIDYQLSTVESVSESGRTFDLVFNMEVVEHVADLKGFMKACNALVKPDGSHFVASINKNWLSWLVAIVGAEYILKWLPKGTHRYAMLRHPKEIISLLQESGLKPVDQSGVFVNPITKTMSLSSSLWVNYMLHARRIRSKGNELDA